mgnify:FL=1
MLKFPGIGQPIAVSGMLGLSLLISTGCRHADHHQQRCPVASNYYVDGPYSTPHTMSQPQPGASGESPMPPAPEPMSSEPEPIPPAPREAYSEPSHRNPVQAIKDGLRPLGSKLGQLIKRDEAEIVEEPVGRDRVYSPNLPQQNTATTQPEWNYPAGSQPPSATSAGPAYPPAVPPAHDYEGFESGNQYQEVQLPQENIPGDVQLPHGNAEFHRPSPKYKLPVSDPQGEFDLYMPRSRESAPTPHLAPVPSDGQEALDEFKDDDNTFRDANFGGDELDSPGPQLLHAPDDGGAKQVKFVPVENAGLSVFQIGTFALCSEVRSYEDFSEIDRSGLRAGQELLIYNTLRNTESVKSAEGFRTLTRSSVEWLGNGDRVLHQT